MTRLERISQTEPHDSALCDKLRVRRHGLVDTVYEIW